MFPGIYRIIVPLPDNPLKELNSYLIKGTRNLLIDTGFRREECRRALTESLSELCVSMQDTDIYITHCHADHAGLAPDLASPSSRVWISNTDMRWLKAETRDSLERELTERYYRSGIRREEMDEIDGTHPGRAFSPDRGFQRYEGLQDGNVLDVGDYHFKIIFTPGHTPGNTCLWEKDQLLMFTGDHVLFDITPNITFWPGMDDSLGSYLDYLRSAREYPVKTALPGHRGQGDYRARIEELLTHHKNRVDECLKIVQERPGLCPYDIAGLMKWHVRARDWNSFPIAQKWFAVGECMAHLDYLKKRNLVRCEIDERGVEHYQACTDQRDKDTGF